MIDKKIYTFAETKACPSCLFVQESAMYRSFQCAYWHLFCTGTWYCTAEEARLHHSPSSSSLALFQIDTPIFCSPFSLQHLKTGGSSSILPTPLSCKPLSSLEMPSPHESPMLCCTLARMGVPELLCPGTGSRACCQGQVTVGSWTLPCGDARAPHGPCGKPPSFQTFAKGCAWASSQQKQHFFLVEAASAQIHV